MPGIFPVTQLTCFPSAVAYLVSVNASGQPKSLRIHKLVVGKTIIDVFYEFINLNLKVMTQMCVTSHIMQQGHGSFYVGVQLPSLIDESSTENPEDLKL